MIEKHISLVVRVDSDGRLTITSPDLLGLFLASNNHDAVWADLGPAIALLLRLNDAR